MTPNIRDEWDSLDHGKPEATTRAHTPGPWRYQAALTASENHRGFVITQQVRRGYRFIANVSPMITDTSGDASAEGCANARLISAAPELLEALRDLLDIYVGLAASGDAGNWDYEAEEEVIAARAAIAKAEAK